MTFRRPCAWIATTLAPFTPIRAMVTTRIRTGRSAVKVRVTPSRTTRPACAWTATPAGASTLMPATGTTITRTGPSFTDASGWPFPAAMPVVDGGVQPPASARFIAADHADDRALAGGGRHVGQERPAAGPD